MRVQYLTYLAFDGRLNRTICAIQSEAEMTRFAQAFPDYAGLPTVNPLHDPIPTFETAAAAVAYFKEKMQ